MTMAAQQIRVGIVGATVTRGGSGWGANAHVPALHALPNYELKAVCTAHPDTAQASAAAFGVELAFDNFETMVARPDIDLVVVSVRVPKHHDLVMQALGAGKAVLCEWPLGANVAEAERMANLAAQRSLPSAVGLQARSDPTLMYARELVQQGHIGEVIGASLTVISQAITERGEGRIWQGRRTNGANTLTIAAGHAIDALCFVLGEFTEVSARLATTIAEWHNSDTGTTMSVDSPDWISVNGRLESGAQVSFLVATVPANPSGNRFEIYGRDGTLSISGSSLNSGPSQLRGAQGNEPLAPMDTPERFTLVPEQTPAGPPRNVAQAYVRLAEALASTAAYTPDFAHAVRRHRLIEAIERSSAEGKAVAVPPSAAHAVSIPPSAA
jgi:predicted dehydrogenase